MARGRERESAGSKAPNIAQQRRSGTTLNGICPCSDQIKRETTRTKQFNFNEPVIDGIVIIITTNT